MLEQALKYLQPIFKKALLSMIKTSGVYVHLVILMVISAVINFVVMKHSFVNSSKKMEVIVWYNIFFLD